MKLERNAAGLGHALEELDIGLRYNVRAMRHEFREGGCGPWQPANDRIEAAIQERIACSFVEHNTDRALRFRGAGWRQSLNALLAEREVDPFFVWLNGLPAHDGTCQRV